VGMDLTLYPAHRQSNENRLSEEWLQGSSPTDRHKPFVLGNTKLSFNQNYKLFEQIEGFGGGKDVVPAYHIPPGTTLYSYGDNGLEHHANTPYGDSLTFAWGKDMKKIVPCDDETCWNKAILTFIKSMPDDTVYILWWH
jgi:hypothetical protein